MLCASPSFWRSGSGLHVSKPTTLSCKRCPAQKCRLPAGSAALRGLRPTSWHESLRRLFSPAHLDDRKQCQHSPTPAFCESCGRVLSSLSPGKPQLLGREEGGQPGSSETLSLSGTRSSLTFGSHKESLLGERGFPLPGLQASALALLRYLQAHGCNRSSAKATAGHGPCQPVVSEAKIQGQEEKGELTKKKKKKKKDCECPGEGSVGQ